MMSTDETKSVKFESAVVISAANMRLDRMLLKEAKVCSHGGNIAIKETDGSV